MIITENLHARRVGDILILSDDPSFQAKQIHPKALLIATDLAAAAVELHRWLAEHQIDEAAEALSISRSSAHRLRQAMGISPRGHYEK